MPWRHHVEIVSKCNSAEEALFYLQSTIEEGWSRNALIDCIKADLYHNKGVANTNFAEKLPGVQGKIAQEIVKDTYDFSFISLPRGYDETVLEEALEQNITRFLLELGMGFAKIKTRRKCNGHFREFKHPWELPLMIILNWKRLRSSCLPRKRFSTVLN